MYAWSGWSPWGMTNGVATIATMENVCNNARDTAIATYGGTRGDYRSVLVRAFIGNNSDGSGKILYDGMPAYGALWDALNAQWPSLMTKLKADAADMDGYRQDVKVYAQVAMAADASRSKRVCVVLNQNQPEQNYDLSLSTQAQFTPNASSVVNAPTLLEGSSGWVRDHVTLNRNGSSLSESVDIQAWLNYNANYGWGRRPRPSNSPRR